MIGQSACKATPRPFQSTPPKSQPRIHSCATQAEASRKASRKLFVDLCHGELGAATIGLRPRASIALHLSAWKSFAPAPKAFGATTEGDRKSVVEGKSVDLGGRRIIKKKKDS